MPIDPTIKDAMESGKLFNGYHMFTHAHEMSCSGVSIDRADYHVYVITVQCSNDLYFYVGQSSRIYKRLYDHHHCDFKFVVPTSDGLEKQSYSLIAINKVIPVNGNKSDARLLERNVYDELCDSAGSMVLGGK